MTDAMERMCANHHVTPAAAACTECAKSICDVCTEPCNSLAFCPGCRVGRSDQLPWLAAVFSFLMPGFGQVYNGDWGKGVGAFLLGPLIVPWLWSVVDAAQVASQIRYGRREGGTVPTGWVLVALKVLWLPLVGVYVLWFMLAIGLLNAVYSALS